MAARRDTKRMLANELEEMMETTPLSKVRVRDLCERLGVERRVFYYHFRDKYDLVAWIFEQDQGAAQETAGLYTMELYEEAHRRIWARRQFYRRAFEDDSQNSIRDYLVEFSIIANERALKRLLGVAKLSDEYRFQAAHFAHGNIDCVIDWLQGSIKATPAQMARYMFDAMPEPLAEAYRRQAASASYDAPAAMLELLVSNV